MHSLLDETERMWEQAGDRLFRERLGIGLSDARPSDVARLFRAPELDTSYPADRMLPALEATLGELGIDLRAQGNVHLDLESRPGKSPRAFCSPIEIPGKVMLVIQPIGGHDDWRALFHEAGHTEHYANTSGDLPMEAKRLGDMAVTEGWAALFERLVDEPAWLNRRLDVPDISKITYDGAVSTLYFLRRYSAKLLYEIEFFQADDPESMRPRYAELLTDALKLPANPESYLDDIDGSFYVTGYLRSWAFEAQLRDYLRSELGNEWFARREAGDLLRELWSLGQGPSAEELLRDVTGARLEMGSIAERRAKASAPSPSFTALDDPPGFPSKQSGEPGPCVASQSSHLTSRSSSSFPYKIVTSSRTKSKSVLIKCATVRRGSTYPEPSRREKPRTGIPRW